MNIEIKRIYDLAEAHDGKRILVDRLWPRGISKEKAKLDDWLKDIAPSQQLRVWFGHKPDRFNEFVERYRLELDTDPEKQSAVLQLIEITKKNNVTLLYGAKDTSINQAVVLKDYLQEKNSHH
ncbi:MAG: DUF488 domain-containing protein [Synergistaceae bacterium]|nr:DUF488 domain-containing protein [Synergistaceae bacterium]